MIKVGYFFISGLTAFLKLLVILTATLIEKFRQSLELLTYLSSISNFFNAFLNALENTEFVFQCRETGIEFLPLLDGNNDRSLIAFVVGTVLNLV